MKRLLLAGFKQETAVFNPVPTRYDHFHIRRGEEIATSLRRTSRPVHIMDRTLFQAHGLEPAAFDLVVVKSPNGFRPHYEAVASAIVPVDAPGATSADLRSLPYTRCVRPIFPLDEEVVPPFSLEGDE